MEPQVDEPGEGLSRRSMLKRGALVGAGVWVVPLVEFVSATPAHAESASSPGGGTGGQTVHHSNPVGQTGGITAETGTALPVGPTVAIGAATVVAGAGAVAAAHILGKRKEAGPEPDPS